ncbi:mycofactocin oligosaccharide methyltransferase MftM [Nocardioides zeae]|uniref:Mycofactocin oligosaccharide methyltransferase MftM n=1 Tax=Nocardioides imazamoxiresistens TaxID=3231893 RepID=A0ABU3PY28_9ACTN|nr:mycofactocin oligosaccharide methyltransferase MftM [Nocardioides zeae]MDT9594146.1 mycofactocin oligosaccharide methyltransferase MftM [Nocardioides zeae]
MSRAGLDPPGVAEVRPLDPFTPVAADGAYRDDVVEVRAVGGHRSRRGLHTVRTTHFDLTPAGDGRRIRIEHVLRDEQVDDDIAGLVSTELFGPGWLRGVAMFERVFTGVVRSVRPDPAAAWALFYRNTMERLDAEQRAGTHPSGPGGAHGTIAEYAPVYAHAEGLLADGSVLETGCCFGFLSLRLAAAGRSVTASDLAPGTVRLLGETARRLDLPVRTLVADAAHHPHPDAAFDNVLVLHLLEHVDADHGRQVLAEALRLARRRVVVAVPLEDVAEETWGHVRTISLADLDAWGAATGRPYDVHELHGGWLVVDLDR